MSPMEKTQKRTNCVFSYPPFFDMGGYGMGPANPSAPLALLEARSPDLGIVRLSLKTSKFPEW